MRFIDVGAVVIDIDKLLYVERGRWREDKKDWEAVLVLVGGVRCEPKVFVQEVRALIVETPLLDGSGTRV